VNKRYITGLILIIVAVGAVYYLPSELFLYFVMITGYFTYREYTIMMNKVADWRLMPLGLLMMLTIHYMSHSTDMAVLLLFAAALFVPLMALFGNDTIEKKWRLQ